MATVPRVANTSVELRPLGTPYQSAAGATPEAFGAGNARALIEGGQRLGQAANQIGELALRIKADDDEREAKDADIAFRQRKLGILRGDGTTENPGFFGTLGQTAIDGYGTSRKALEQSQEEIAKGMKSDRARRLFLESAQRQVVDADEQMIGHVTRQRKEASDATSISRINSAASEAALFPNDPKVVSKGLGIAEAEAAAISQRNGETGDVAADRARTARTSVVKSAVDAAIENDVKTAEGIYKQYVGSIDGRQAALMRKAIDEKLVVVESQVEADKIWEEAKKNGWDEVRTKDEVRKRLEGKVEDSVITRLNQRFADMNQREALADARDQRARRQRQQTEEDEARRAFDQIRREGGTPEEQLKKAEALNGRVFSLVTAEIDNLRRRESNAAIERDNGLRREAFAMAGQGKNPEEFSPEMKASIRTDAEWQALTRAYARVSSGAPVVTNWGKYAEYQSQVRDPDQARFVNLEEARGYLADPQFAELARLKAAAENGKLDINAKNDAGAVNSVLNGFGFYKSAKKDDKERLLVAFLSEIDSVRSVTTAGKLTPEEREAVIERAAVRYIRKGGILGNTQKENEEAIAADANLSSLDRATRFFVEGRGKAAASIPGLRGVPVPSPEQYAATAGPIPPQVRTKIISRLRGLGVRNPNEEQIRVLYAGIGRQGE
jgi:hypothetical protein